jgi:hypothetical protein
MQKGLLHPARSVHRLANSLPIFPEKLGKTATEDEETVIFGGSTEP